MKKTTTLTEDGDLPMLSMLASSMKHQESLQQRQVPVAAELLEPVQLPIWENDLRGLPNSLARGALFTAAKACKTIKREFYEGKQVATLNGLRIEYHGQELRQDDNSVFMTLLHFGRHFELGQPIPFTAYSMLKELGWTVNSAEYKHLRECCMRLSATNVTVTHEKGGAGYAGSLIRSFAWKDTKGKQLSSWVVLLEPSIVTLFSDNSFTLVEWAERKSIGGRSPLALWLHCFLCTHREPLPISVEKYHELSASRAVSMPDFRRRLKQALAKLVEIGFLKAFTIKDDIVHVLRVPKQFRRPKVALPQSGELLLEAPPELEL